MLKFSSNLWWVMERLVQYGELADASGEFLYSFADLEKDAPTGMPPIDIQRKVIERLCKEGVIEIVKDYYADQITNWHPIKRQSIPPDGYFLKLIEPNLTEFRLEISSEQRKHKRGRTQLFTYEGAKVFYENGKFYFNDEKKRFYATQTGKIPRKLWDHILKDQFELDSSDLLQVASLADVWESIRSTHREILYDRLKMVFKKNGLDLPDEFLEKNILVEGNESLLLVKR